ncbi:LOW QUALITY PROTEIN: hypothetical protein QC762_105767 [Podospora pseudocomata]|uniref:Uncharacterized protein n=1 Tax=Podospora pseudocomata TaxID=2093779 RepID=A0ABR0GT36_9PEZI|nr:LOW QUALITY PROTEIN: hypothetical protein QC762_105767 [Podospora pseudocomata]
MDALQICRASECLFLACCTTPTGSFPVLRHFDRAGYSLFLLYLEALHGLGELFSIDCTSDRNHLDYPEQYTLVYTSESSAPMTRIRRPLTYSPAWSLSTTHHYCPTCCPLGTPYSDAPITKTPHARRQIQTVKQRPTTHRGTHSNRGISGVTNRKGNGNDDKTRESHYLFAPHKSNIIKHPNVEPDVDHIFGSVISPLLRPPPHLGLTGTACYQNPHISLCYRFCNTVHSRRREGTK